MAKAIGIDLGTTNSCAAFLDGGQPVVIPNNEGARTTPSVMALAGDGERLVGQLAKRQAETNPTATVTAVKRLIGRKLDDPRIAQHLRSVPYQVVAAANGDCRVKLGEREFSPAELSAMVLADIKQMASDYLGEEVTEAVITVPAYFDDAQRQATKDAGRIAGLDVLRIINEPTAAALAYGRGEGDGVAGRDEGRAQRVAVYDLGGGTFDISILEIGAGVFQVRSTSGDTYLGGEDFDRRVIDHLAEAFKAETGIDPRPDKLALQRLKEAAERAKQELSSTVTTEVNLPFLCADASGPKHLIAKLTRHELESLTADLIERTLGPCRTALADAGLQPSDIDQVILVGGQTRMPRVQQVVERFFGRRPSQKVNPDEVVAVGAAIQAGILRGEVEDVILLDVTPLSLGVETAGGMFTRIIQRNTTIPVRKTHRFTTAVDNQSFVEVHVLQGERAMSSDNKSLARFQLVGIPPAPRGVPQIEVAFDIDANGIASVTARDLGSGREQTIKVVPSSGLTETEIAKIVAEADAAREADDRRRRLAQARLDLEGLLFSVQRSVEELGAGLPQIERGNVNLAMSKARDALARTSLDDIVSALAGLELEAKRVADLVFSGALGGNKGGK